MTDSREILLERSSKYSLVEHQGLAENATTNDFLQSWWFALQRGELVGLDPSNIYENAHLLPSLDAPALLSLNGLPAAFAQSLPTIIEINHCATELPFGSHSVAKLHGDIAIIKLGKIDSNLMGFINTLGLALTAKQKSEKLQIQHNVAANAEIPVPVTELVAGTADHPFWKQHNIDPIRIIFDPEYGDTIRKKVEKFISLGLIRPIQKDNRYQYRLTPYQKRLLALEKEVYEINTDQAVGFLPSVYYNLRRRAKFHLPNDLPLFGLEIVGNVFGTKTRIGMVETYAAFRDRIQAVIANQLPEISSEATSLRDVRNISRFCINVPEIGKVIFVFSQSSSRCVEHAV